MRVGTIAGLTAVLVAGCGGRIGPSGDDGDTTSETGSDDGSTGTESGDGDGDGEGTTGHPDLPGDGDGVLLVDLLVVVDDSSSMPRKQAVLAKSIPSVVDSLWGLHNDIGEPIAVDVNVMLTTTNMGNPLCEDFQQHPPERGAPIYTGCNERIDRFQDGFDADDSYACTDACPTDVVPENGEHFINFGTAGDNLPDVPDQDVTGDGSLEGPAGQALACLAPMGRKGCGYESPLESMLQALNPGAWWNNEEDGRRPFMRKGSVIMILVVSDEADCSIKDFDVFDPSGEYGTDYWNERPGMGVMPSSAICWNAGVECGEPDQNGVYADCEATDTGVMMPVSRYTDYLVGYLTEQTGRHVFMTLLTGVPSVVRNQDGDVVSGGIEDVVYRDWRDPVYPAGDILPDDAADGIDAAHKQWAFGIGPGCTGEDGMGGFIGQGLPPVRMREVCHALDGEEQQCCIESICDDDYRPAVQCGADMLQQAIVQDALPDPP